MSNFNNQLPLRSIANASIGQCTRGWSSSSVGGPALSDGCLPNIFDERQLVELRTMQELGGGPMVSNMSRGYDCGSLDTATTSLLDLSEFPSLTNVRGQIDHSMPKTISPPPSGTKPYVGMFKQSTEFTMSNENFPPLPGTQNSYSSMNSGLSAITLDDGVGKTMNSIVCSGLTAVGGVIVPQNDNSSNIEIMKRGVQTSSDGKVTNIPPTILNNQFGLLGLLTFIRAAETNPNIVTSAMGIDLTGLGLNLDSQEYLYPTFAGPFADQPCRIQAMDYSVPPEYFVNFAIRDKLSNPDFKNQKEDLLFFLFYTNIGDVIQLRAAAELYNREWRYHIEEKIWITRIMGVNQYEQNGTKERGIFFYFDVQAWRRMYKFFEIDHEKLDKCPNISEFLNIN